MQISLTPMIRRCPSTPGIPSSRAKRCSGLFDQADDEFRKVLDSTPPNDPKAAATLNYLGYMNADRGVKLEESLGFIKQPIALEPNNCAYLDSLGWVYFKLGKYDMAEENLNKAAVQMGLDPTVQEHLGDLYQKTGRLKLAAVHWDRATQTGAKPSRPSKTASLRQSPEEA